MVVMAIRLTLNEFVISLDRLVNMLQMEPPTLQKLCKERTTWVGELHYKTCELKKRTTGKWQR
jgi:hypothetical protein